MPLTNYDYDIASDFPGGAVNPTKLDAEIRASAITIALNRIDTSGDTVSIWFNDALPTGDKTILDGDTTGPAGGLIAAHDNSPTPDDSQVVMTAQQSFGSRVAGYVGSSATSTVTVRATSYTPPGNNGVRYVKSTSASDTAAGIGARKVKIFYFRADGTGDVDGRPLVSEVTLNGTSEVVTSENEIALIESAEVSEVGSNGGNVGTIQILGTSGGAVVASIAAGDNQTYWAHHYVPPNFACFVECVMICQRANTAGAAVLGVATMNKIDPLNAVSPQKNLDVSIGYAGTTVPVDFEVPIRVDGPAIIFLNARPSATTASTIHGGFGFYQLPIT